MAENNSNKKSTSTDFVEPFDVRWWGNFLGWLVQIGILLFVAVTIGLSLVALIFSDVYAGQVGLGAQIRDSNVSTGISLAETGVLLALSGYIGWIWENTNWKNKEEKRRALVKIGIALIFYIPFGGIDIFFDMKSVDMWKYGEYVVLSDLPQVDRFPIVALRTLVSGISTFGEGMAIFALLFVGLFRIWINEVFDDLARGAPERKSSNSPFGTPNNVGGWTHPRANPSPFAAKPASKDPQNKRWANHPAPPAEPEELNWEEAPPAPPPARPAGPQPPFRRPASRPPRR